MNISDLSSYKETKTRHTEGLIEAHRYELIPTRFKNLHNTNICLRRIISQDFNKDRTRIATDYMNVEEIFIEDYFSVDQIELDAVYELGLTYEYIEKVSERLEELELDHRHIGVYKRLRLIEEDILLTLKAIEALG